MPKMSDNAQSADQTPDGSNPATTQTAVPPGVQSRFDELTGIIHEKQRQMDAMSQTMQELIATTAANAAKQSMAFNQNTPAQALPEGIDPSLVSYLSNQMTQTMSQQMAAMEQKIASMVGGVRQSQEMMEFQAASQGVDPTVAAEAQKLMQTWKRNGFTGWKPEDAIVYATGLVATKQRAAQNRNRPNGDGNDALSVGGGSMPSTSNSLPPPKSDEEMRGMSIQQQEAYWASRVGNSELKY